VTYSSEVIGGSVLPKSNFDQAQPPYSQVILWLRFALRMMIVDRGDHHLVQGALIQLKAVRLPGRTNQPQWDAFLCWH
jgi:hypothetical protein